MRDTMHTLARLASTGSEFGMDKSVDNCRELGKLGECVAQRRNFRVGVPLKSPDLFKRRHTLRVVSWNSDSYLILFLRTVRWGVFRFAYFSIRLLVNNKLSPRMSRVPRRRPWRTSAFLSYIAALQTRPAFISKLCRMPTCYCKNPLYAT